MKSYDELLALGELDLFLEKVRNHTSKKIRNRDFAGMEREDVIQEVLIKVYKSIESFDPSKSKASTFVDHVIENKIKDCLRSAGSESNLCNVNSVPLIDDTSGEEYIEGTIIIPVEESMYSYIEYLQDIKNIDLTEKETEVVKLKIAGYNNTEIANILGCTRATVHNIWNKIKDKFEVLER